MAEKQFGTAHVFGLDGSTIANATIIEKNLDKGFALDDKTPDEDGVTVENRMDDRVITGSVRLFIQSGYSIPAQGDLITLSGLTDTALNVEYVIKSVGEAYRAGQKVEITLNLESHEGIDYSPA